VIKDLWKRALAVTVAGVVAQSPALADRGGAVYHGPRGGAAAVGPRGGAAVRGPYGGGAARGPYGGGAVRGPYGGGAVRGPYGGGAVRGPYGGGAVRGPYGGAAVRGPYGGAAVRGRYGGAVGVGPRGAVAFRGRNFYRPGWSAARINTFSRPFWGYPGWRAFGTYGLAPALLPFAGLGFLSAGLLIGSYAYANRTVYVYVVDNQGVQEEYRVDSDGNILSRRVVVQ
jgi:hypothetical protein